MTTKRTIRMAIENAYIQGATKQHAIDIQRAVKWLKETYIEQYLTTICSGGYEEHKLNNKFFNDFIKAIKEE